MNLFAFEGIDEVGKSTLIQEVSNILKKQYHIIIGSDENNSLGKMAKQSIEMMSSIDWLLWLSARKKECNKIKENSTKDSIILYDRYWYSTLVYSKTYDNDSVVNLVRDSNVFIKPKCVFLIDKANRRIQDGKQLKFYELLEKYDDKFYTIDNSDLRKTAVYIALLILKELGILGNIELSELQQLICKYCQLCCQWIGIRTSSPYDDINVQFYEARGFICENDDGNLFLSQEQSCPHLKSNGCDIYHKRPRVCCEYDGRIHFEDKCLWSQLDYFNY